MSSRSLITKRKTSFRLFLLILTIILLSSSSVIKGHTDGSSSLVSLIQNGHTIAISGEKLFDKPTWLAGIGDVNNDEYDDFVIGSYQNSEGGIFAGKVYLILGKATNSWENYDLSQADASFMGESSHDYAGIEVSGVGDTNNDGYNDFIIGAPRNDEKLSDSGQTYLIFGRPTDEWKHNVSLGEVDASFIGEGPGNYAGHYASGVGDVNHDGYDDIVISSAHYSSIAPWAGKVYLILGRPTEAFHMDISLAEANASFHQPVHEWFLGTFVDAAGDVNNDGIDDFLVGQYQYQDHHLNSLQLSHSSPGEYQIFLMLERETQNWIPNQSIYDVANASFLTEEVPALYGAFRWLGSDVRSSSGVGDVNGDGYSDLMFGTWQNNEVAEAAGKTFLYYGRDTAELKMNTSLSSANAMFLGEKSRDHSGFATSGLGDLNNDGFADFGITAPGYSHDFAYENRRGKSYIFLGGENKWSQNTSLSSADAIFEGICDGDGFGMDIIGAGDVDNNNYDEILISAPQRNSVGEVYLFLNPFEPGYLYDTADFSSECITKVGSISSSSIDRSTPIQKFAMLISIGIIIFLKRVKKVSIFEASI